MRARPASRTAHPEAIVGATGTALGPASRTAAAAVATALLCGALTLQPARGEGLDLPEQIGTPQAGGADQIRIEEIGPGDAGNPVTVEQSEGGHDLCDPSVSEATRRRAGVDCSAPETAGRGAAGAPRTGTVDDPLLRPRDDDQRRQFESLDLGDDVPATVILQQ